MRRRRKGKSARLSQKLDVAWSRLIRSKGYCERCGKKYEPERLHAHHIVGRRNHRVRWDPRNGCALDYRCHRFVHEEPLEFARWIQWHRPADVEYLDSIKNEIAHWTDRDKEEMLADLEWATNEREEQEEAA